jgi:hypothetical protein
MLKSPARWWLLLPVLISCAHAASPKSGSAAAAAAKAGPKPEVIGFWRFEHDVKPEGRGASLQPPQRLSGPVFFFNDEVPGPFVYDPLQRLSYPNTASLSFQSDDKHNDALEVALNTAKTSLAGQSVTLELFFKPNAEWSGPLAMKSRLNDGAAEWGLEALYFEKLNQTYVHAFFTAPGGQTEHFRPGHFGTSAQIRSENMDWRHAAFVYDATAKTLSCYIDYYQVKTIALPGEMKWDAGALYIGGGPTRSSFGGKIDEVRLTKGALRPSQFLRVRRDPAAGLSFEGAETILPRDSGYIDLKESFGALGDGKTDDTAAFREAFRVLSNQPTPDHNTLYIPPGNYLVTDTLLIGRSLSVIGGGADKTVIKLRDKCTGFSRAADARPVWQVDTTQAPPLPAGVPSGCSGIDIRHLTIDTGKGNTGAKGLDVESSLLQRIDDVQIRSGDAAGLVGLDLAPKAGGAALIKNLRVKGFDYGIISSGADSTMTLEQIGLDGQRLGGTRTLAPSSPSASSRARTTHPRSSAWAPAPWSRCSIPRSKAAARTIPPCKAKAPSACCASTPPATNRQSASANSSTRKPWNGKTRRSPAPKSTNTSATGSSAAMTLRRKPSNSPPKTRLRSPGATSTRIGSAC